jgi:hypothetical protein
MDSQEVTSMLDKISSAAQSQLVQTQLTSQAAASSQNSAPAKQQPASVDTVQLSSTARSIAQEALETPAQTAREANAGDAQAKRLLAREARH